MKSWLAALLCAVPLAAAAQTFRSNEHSFRVTKVVEGLEQPEGLEVKMAGDSATVQIPGGHEVRLRREAGVWRVEDFD